MAPANVIVLNMRSNTVRAVKKVQNHRNSLLALRYIPGGRLGSEGTVRRARKHHGDGGYLKKELKALESQIMARRRSLWVGVAAVLIPLAIMLALQYSWLADLERSSAVARKAALDNYLEAVAKDVHVYYLKIAERALNLPAAVFRPSAVQKAAHYFKKKEVKGVKALFIVSYLDKEGLYFYNPVGLTMEVPKLSPETLAVWAAVSPWKYQAKKGAKFDTTVFSVDQRDPENRIILNPITDDSSRLVGLAGLIVDESFFVNELLPKAVMTSLPKFHEKERLHLCVNDQRERRVYPAVACTEQGKPVARRAFNFVFTDWTLSLHGDLCETEAWARTNFAFNMTLSALLAFVLVSGIAMTLRTAARELRLSAMKNDFVSNVSHELRTPLSSIRVFGEFMRRGRVSDPDKVREYGTHIESESRRLTQLINNILDFSRIESGCRVYTFETADLEEVVTETLATFAVRLRNKGFELVFEGPDEPLPEVLIDSNAIDRALANLIDNAVKYSNGGDRILIRLARNHDEVEISVTDRGIGIPRSEQKRIFERFHRVSTGLVHDVKGTGLGLSLVQHIVHAHGGRITVESEVARGSTFTIHLPLEHKE
jgi:signal transduction histidine kinase